MAYREEVWRSEPGRTLLWSPAVCSVLLFFKLFLFLPLLHLGNTYSGSTRPVPPISMPFPAWSTLRLHLVDQFQGHQNALTLRLGQSPFSGSPVPGVSIYTV